MFNHNTFQMTKLRINKNIFLCENIACYETHRSWFIVRSLYSYCKIHMKINLTGRFDHRPVILLILLFLQYWSSSLAYYFHGQPFCFSTCWSPFEEYPFLVPGPHVLSADYQKRKRQRKYNLIGPISPHQIDSRK